MLRFVRIPTGKATHLIVESSGLAIVGEGWKGKRGWKKLHLGVDGSGIIVAQVLTDGLADDAATVPDLLGRRLRPASGALVLRS